MKHKTPKIRKDDKGFHALYFCDKDCPFLRVKGHHNARCDGLMNSELVFHDDFNAKCVYDLADSIAENSKPSPPSFSKIIDEHFFDFG